MPYPQYIRTYYQTTMMPKVPQGMGFYYGHTRKWSHCTRTALKAPPLGAAVAPSLLPHPARVSHDRGDPLPPGADSRCSVMCAAPRAPTFINGSTLSLGTAHSSIQMVRHSTTKALAVPAS